MILIKPKLLPLLTIALLILSAQATLAASQPANNSPLALFINKLSSSPLVATFNIGPVWENAGHRQTFYLTPSIEKTYAPSESTHALADGELFLGWQRTLTDVLHAQWGLAIATTGNADLSGHIWDDADPVFNNYQYTYQVQHTHIAVKGKLLRDTQFYALRPYISGSLGVGFNRAHNYSSTPTLFQAVATPNFSANTSTSFTYTLGVGVQRTLKEHWQAGIGYEFADWGSSHLGRAPGQTLNEGISLNHLYTNGLLFNLTWIA